MFLVSYIYRTQSSGYETRQQHLFDTLEKAAEYIRTQWYDLLCESNDYPTEWDEEDLGAPMPTRDHFSLEAIKMAKSTVLFAPFSQYAGLVQNELHLEQVHVT